MCVCVCVCMYVCIYMCVCVCMASQVGAVVKNPPAGAGDARDLRLIPGSGRSPEIGNDNPLQYSCLENSMERGAWQATVHGVTKCQTQPSTHVYMPLCVYVYTYTQTQFVFVSHLRVL